nr:hypothetical protein [Marasmius tenuissimus]
MTGLKNRINTLFTFVAGAVGHYYVGKILENKEKLADIEDQNTRDKHSLEMFDSLKNTQGEVSEIKGSVSEIKDQIKDLILSNEFKIKIQNYISQIAKNLEGASSNLTESMEYSNTGKSVTKEVAEIIDKKTFEGLTNLNEAKMQLYELIKILNDVDKNKFNFDLTSFYAYLDSLSLMEVGALFHILILIIILFSAFNILSIFFSNEIIKFFNLETKYPRLAKFFHLRRVFQKYYLLYNILFIFVVCIVTIYVNILVLY